MDQLAVQIITSLIGSGVLVVIATAVANRRKTRSESDHTEAESTEVITNAGTLVIKNLREEIERLGKVQSEQRVELQELREEIRQKDARHAAELQEERAARRAAEERASRHANSLAEMARLVTTEAFRQAAADLLRTGVHGPLPPIPEPDPEADSPAPPAPARAPAPPPDPADDDGRGTN